MIYHFDMCVNLVLNPVMVSVIYLLLSFSRFCYRICRTSQKDTVSFTRVDFVGYVVYMETCYTVE